ncbi:hypothetical protein AAHA92_05015 [Salvia divinorum]|uniref:Uncharacterized protein n=1 Tax=Salvia divinorum TaxID=28513 RepID=A0ABD1I222_SALDI
MIVEETVPRLKSGDLREKIEAAKDVRKSSNSNSKFGVRSRFAIVGTIETLVMLLNLAVRNQSEVLCFGFSFSSINS